MAGKAEPELLDSYSVERQPVGVGIVTRANQGLRDHLPWMKTIGMLEVSVEERRKVLSQFHALDETGRQRRRAWMDAISNTATEFHGLGIEMNQHYESSKAVSYADECTPLASAPDAVSKYHISTYPGKRMPHAWVNTRQVGTPISTIDLAGKGCFCLLTGPGGQQWKEAAQEVAKALELEIRAYSIGWGEDFEDVYFDWARRREVDEDGCVLIRPDRFVAWRSTECWVDCSPKLEEVMRRVLAR